MAQADDAATPLGLNVAMHTCTPGSRCCGNPGLIGVFALCHPAEASHSVGFDEIH